MKKEKTLKTKEKEMKKKDYFEEYLNVYRERTNAGTKVLIDILQYSFDEIIDGLKKYDINDDHDLPESYFYLIFKLTEALTIVQDEKPNLTEQLVIVAWILNAIPTTYGRLEDCDKPFAKYNDSTPTYILNMLLNYCVYELRTIANTLESDGDIGLDDLCYEMQAIKFRE